MNRSDRATTRLGTLLVLLAATLWGTTGTAATFAPGVSPLAIGAVAMGVGGLLQAGVAAGGIRSHARDLRAHRTTVAVGAASVAIYPLAFYSSMHLAGVATGTVVSIGAAPLACALIERVADGRPLTRRWMVATGLGVAGTVLLCVAHAAAPGTSDAGALRTLFGIGLGLVAATTYALYSWAAHRLMSHSISAAASMGTIFGVGGLLLVPVILATGAPLLSSWTNLGVGIYLALIPMFVGYLAFGWGLRHVTAGTATTLTLLEPAVAAVLAVAVVGEQLPAAGWVGILLIAACLAVLTVPRRTRAPRDVTPSACATSRHTGTTAATSIAHQVIPASHTDVPRCTSAAAATPSAPNAPSVHAAVTATDAAQRPADRDRAPISESAVRGRP
ncbi:EamA family transporter [Gordonia sp. VNQ95]|uniref:DMT family transporter n=1 Tax=Gordonia sp. VNQ95 TaxID=3156619 RepID=UPI0032B47713